MPLNAFYYFLYYTETLSTVSLVMTYYMVILVDSNLAEKSNDNSVQKIFRGSVLHTLFMFLAASATILVRQTNAIWVVFFCGVRALHIFSKHGKFEDGELNMANLCKFIRCLTSMRMQVLACILPAMLPVAAFLVFVVYNKGVVVGDRVNHSSAVHTAMPLHMFAIYVMVLSPVILAEICTWFYIYVYDYLDAKVNVLNKFRQSKFHWGTLRVAMWDAVGLVCVTLAIWKGSRSHPFLLADNRHYTFYVWQRILSKPQTRLALSPLYYICTTLAIWRLRAARGGVWVLGYLAAVVITLIPAPLLEPRYFTPAIVMALLHTPPVRLEKHGCLRAWNIYLYTYRYAYL